MLAHGMSMACNKSYRDMVIADGAAYFWDFMDQPNAKAAPAVGGVALNVFGAPSAQQFTQDTNALILNGSSQAAGINQNIINNTNCTIELWMKTTSNYGGPFGCGDKGDTQIPSSYDKICYINSSGKLNYCLWDGASKNLNTQVYVCDGLAHHVVVSINSSYTDVFVDGVNRGMIGGVSTSAAKNLFLVLRILVTSYWPEWVSSS